MGTTHPAPCRRKAELRTFGFELREEDDVADGVGAGEQHEQAVDAHAAGRRHAAILLGELPKIIPSSISRLIRNAGSERAEPCSSPVLSTGLRDEYHSLRITPR